MNAMPPRRIVPRVVGVLVAGAITSVIAATLHGGVGMQQRHWLAALKTGQAAAFATANPADSMTCVLVAKAER